MLIALNQITPNPKNAEIFRESLEDLKALHTSIQTQGLLSPLIVCDTPETKNLLLDGERRYRVLLELNFKTVEVTHLGPLTAEEANRHIYEAYSTHRDASLPERARLYRIIVADLTERFGGTHGGDRSQSAQRPTLKRKAIRQRAARLAGLSSSHYADMLLYVLDKGSPQIQQRFLDKDHKEHLSLNAAYLEIRSDLKEAKKRAEKKRHLYIREKDRRSKAKLAPIRAAEKAAQQDNLLAVLEEAKAKVPLNPLSMLLAPEPTQHELEVEARANFEHWRPKPLHEGVQARAALRAMGPSEVATLIVSLIDASSCSQADVLRALNVKGGNSSPFAQSSSGSKQQRGPPKEGDGTSSEMLISELMNSRSATRATF